MTNRLACYALCALLCVSSYPVEAQDSKNIPELGFLWAGAAQDDSDRLAFFGKGDDPLASGTSTEKSRSHIGGATGT
jgi:hypothetical protein